MINKVDKGCCNEWPPMHKIKARDYVVKITRLSVTATSTPSSKIEAGSSSSWCNCICMANITNSNATNRERHSLHWLLWPSSLFTTKSQCPPVCTLDWRVVCVFRIGNRPPPPPLVVRRCLKSVFEWFSNSRILIGWDLIHTLGFPKIWNLRYVIFQVGNVALSREALSWLFLVVYIQFTPSEGSKSFVNNSTLKRNWTM
jgi:hypothetical protein